MSFKMRQGWLQVIKMVAVFAVGFAISSMLNVWVVGAPVLHEVAANVPSVPDTVKAVSALVPQVPNIVSAPTSKEVAAIAQKGDTLLGFLKRGGLNATEAFEVSNALQGNVSASALHTGQPMKVTLVTSPKNPSEMVLKSLQIPYTEKVIEISRKEDGKLDVNAVVKPLKKELVRAGATIYDSLMGSAEGVGVPYDVMQAIINAYSYDVDFQRDIQVGDRFEVVYESMQDSDGHHVKSGDVLYAKLVLSGSERPIYYYADNSGQGGFYSQDGKSVKRNLLKTPINGARVTSGYGMRMHPILGYSKMHRGVDFAAPMGTPVYAAGDGKIAEEGRKNGYGNYVRIRHSGEFSTAYAHLSRFASGVRSGGYVKQGQVIAYVGMTGRATGPHLHFELIRGSTQVNPSSIRAVPATALTQRELPRFRRQQERLHLIMASLPIKTQLASLK